MSLGIVGASLVFAWGPPGYVLVNFATERRGRDWNPG